MSAPLKAADPQPNETAELAPDLWASDLRAAPRLLPLEVACGVALAGASGAAILVHVFTPIALSFTAPLVVLPSAIVLGALVLLQRGLYRQLHWFSALVIAGAVCGLGATLVYDAIRPALLFALGISYDPYRAIAIFGQLITNLPATDPRGLLAGWLYHFWNGISFGIVFALVRPRGGVVAGLLWALILQGLMMAAYPSFLQVRLNDPGFMVAGLVGHGFWGVVLGASLRRWSYYF